MSGIESVYQEEVIELLEKLESSLLLLEITPTDDELIEDIFRSMHTIKGSSSMFGYDNVAAFVHNLESIYDYVREGSIEATKQLIDITLSSLDHIKKIVNDTDLQDEKNQENHETLTKKILSLMGEKVALIPEIELEPKEIEKPTITTFYISFIPNENIFKDGTNPLFLLDELYELGDCEIFPRFKEIKTIEEFNPTKCSSYWEILIATKVSKNELLDVFLFVEGDSEIIIEQLCNFNLLTLAEAKPIIKQLSKMEDNKPFNLDELKNIIKNTVEEQPLITPTPKLQEKTTVVAKEQKNIQSIRVASDKLDSLMSIVSELVTTQASLSLYAETNVTPELEVISENVEKLSRLLRDTAFGMTLIPIKNIMSRFQRLVRDVSNDLGKTINFKIEGDETELDKNIIESLTDPLMHILRNSLDHGIESEEERTKNNKPVTGNILFKAFYSGASVHIQIKDDGKGIDSEAVREKAIARGLTTEDAVLTEKEIFDFIFYPGFSTTEQVTEVSGRGVGMDVVKRNINELRGDVEITSTVGIGTTITIKLPLTLSIIDGLLVKIGNSNYVVPLSVVEKCYELPYSDLQNNFNNLLLLDEEQVPYINTRKEFQIEDETPEVTQIIVVNDGEKRVGITVDSIIDEYQAVLKPIGKYYKNQEYISGATILGDGTIALVIDTNKIINRFSEHTINA